MIRHSRLYAAMLAGLLVVGVALAQDDSPGLATAQGMIDKVEKDSLIVRPRSAEGRFEKSLNLKLTGTSKIALLSYQKRGTKMVPVQKEADAKELAAKQTIALIYSTGPDGMVLLSAVVLPPTGK